MANFAWKELLTRWSLEVLKIEDWREQMEPEVIASEWLGYPGATEAQIAEQEARLGIKLPPSYREFLKVSNGWRVTSPFIYEVQPIERVDWLAKTDPHFAQLLGGNDQNHEPTNYEFDSSGNRVVKMLQVSEWGDAAVYLLNPAVVTSEGEWSAWFWGSWVPGEVLFKSFWELMQDEFDDFVRLENEDSGEDSPLSEGE